MYSPRVEQAITTMLEAHGLRRRKAGRTYEATHVLSVALIVHDYGFDEDAVIAAILHDTLEDTDLDPRVISERFGERVLALVRTVTEPSKRHGWRLRKSHYIEQLQASSLVGARAVACADKIHNLSKMTKGLEATGAAYFGPFTASLDDMLWYHDAVLATLREGWDHPILREHESRHAAFRAAASRVADPA